MDILGAVLAREFPGWEPQDVTRLPRGNRKRTFLVEFDTSRVIIQLNGDPEALAVEASLATAVRERTAVPVPAVIGTGCIDGSGYAAVEYASGTDLHEQFTTLSGDDRRNVARTFGRWLAACHDAFSFDGHGQLSLADGRLVAPDCAPAEWFESYLAAGIDALPSALKECVNVEPATAAASYEPSETCLFPWDLRPGNALYDGDVTAVLDWGEPLAAGPSLSVAKTEHLVCDWYVDDPGPLRTAFREGYRDVRPWPAPSPVERIAAIVRSAVDGNGVVTRPGYPEQTGETAVRFHRERLRTVACGSRGV